MKTESEHTAQPSDSESAPALLTAEQARTLLKGIITEAMEGAKLLDEEGGAYSVKELGFYLQEAIMQLVEDLGRTKKEKVSLVLDYVIGGGDAFNSFLADQVQRKTLH